MTYEERDGLRILTADEGRCITNGEVITTKAYLGNGDSPDNWWDCDAPENEIDEQ